MKEGTLWRKNNCEKSLTTPKNWKDGPFTIFQQLLSQDIKKLKGLSKGKQRRLNAEFLTGNSFSEYLTGICLI